MYFLWIALEVLRSIEINLIQQNDRLCEYNREENFAHLNVQIGRSTYLIFIWQKINLAEATGPESRQPAGPVRMVSPASQHSNFKNLQQSLLIANIVIFGRFLKLLCWLAGLTMRTGPAG